MIGSLRGTLLERRPPEILLEVSGVGYRVQLVASAFARLGTTGGELFVYTHHHIREGDQSLYGFLTATERDCFESLIAAHGVGPALAMAILAVHRPDQLVQILADADVSALCLVPGVGKKTAARLLVELRAKLDVDTFLPTAELVSAAPGGAASFPAGPTDGGPRQVVRQALAELGYGPDEIRHALDGLDPIDLTAGSARHAIPSGTAGGDGDGTAIDAHADVKVGVGAGISADADVAAAIGARNAEAATDATIEAALLRAALQRLAGGR